MSRWFRWYEGTSEDGKFRAVARLSRVTVRDVIALWAFMLEDAAHLDHRGVCKRDEDFMSGVLDFEDGIVERILESMESVGMISVGHGEITICNWGKRQFESDADPTASRRKREQRKRDKENCHASVTRDTGGSDTDTDTDTERKNPSGRKAPEVSRVSSPPSSDHPVWWPTRDRYGRITSDVTEKVTYDVGKAVLGRAAGGQVTKLRKLYHGDLRAVTDLLMQAEEKGDASEWIAGVIRKGEQGSPIHPKHEVFPESVYR